MRSLVAAFRMVAVLLAGGLSSTAIAALRWENLIVEHIAPVGQDLVEVSFAFTNPESHPVTIVDVKPDCGCTTATVKMKTYAPGERSVLTAFLDAKGLWGLQEKTIQVFLDDSPKPVMLTLRVTIPQWLQVSPRLLWWSVGDDATAKEARITLSQEAKIKITSVKVDSAAIGVSLQPVEGTGKFRLVAKPVSTATPVQTIVTIAMENPGSAPRSYVVFAQVR